MYKDTPCSFHIFMVFASNGTVKSNPLGKNLLLLGNAILSNEEASSS